MGVNKKNAYITEDGQARTIIDTANVLVPRSNRN